MSFFSRSPQPEAPEQEALASDTLITLRNLEKSYAHGTSRTWVLRRIMADIARVNPGTFLILTGGEPLLRPDVFDLAAEGRAHGFTVVLGTNGVLLRETQALYRANGLRLFSADGIAALAIQAPLFAALFSATRRGLGTKVRFLWVAELARPDALLAWGVSVLTAIVMANTMAASGASTLPANAVAVLGSPG